MTRRAWGTMLLSGTFGSLAGCLLLKVMGPEGDTDAIVAVVEDLYLSEGFGRMLFIGGDEDAGELRKAKEILAQRLAVRVQYASEACRESFELPALTPVDCQTGELGVEIGVGRLTLM